MSLEEFSEQLGVTFDPATSTSPQRPTPQKKDGKVLSFLSDSCYLSSPLWFSGSDSESESEPDLVEEGENVSAGEARGLGSDGKRSGFLCAGSSSSSSLSLSESASLASPLLGGRSLEPPSQLSHTHNPTNHQPPNSLAAPGGLKQELTMSAAANTVCMGLKHELSIATSGNEGLSQKTPHYHKQCVQSSPLARHRSLTRCNTAANCSLPAMGKTDRAHVSCPDFHSCSSDDMELGSVSQDEEPEEMETASFPLLERKPCLSQGNHPKVLGFDLPPLGGQNLMGGRNSPFMAPQNNSTTGNKFSPTTVPKGKSRNTGTEIPPVRGFEIANSRKSSEKKKVPPNCRTPLQSLTNAPSVSSSRQQSTGIQGKQVVQAQPDKPANFTTKY